MWLNSCGLFCLIVGDTCLLNVIVMCLVLCDVFGCKLLLGDCGGLLAVLSYLFYFLKLCYRPTNQPILAAVLSGRVNYVKHFITLCLL